MSRAGYTSRARSETDIIDSSDEELVRRTIENDRQSMKKAKEAWQQASGKKASGKYLPGFFIRIGARYRRIRKRSKGSPSPQLYAYNREKLQELVQQEKDGLIDLYYGDESHICMDGYVPYGWQFRSEDVYIPCERGFRLNIFGMIDRRNRYEGFHYDREHDRRQGR